MSRLLKFGSMFAVLAMVVLLHPAQAQVQRNPLPVPDIPGFHTLKCDLHMHTVFSDGYVWPSTRVAEAYRQGLDVISITDHDDHHPKTGLVSDDCNKPYEIAKPFAGELGIILIPGVEITKGEWHFNALFVKDANATKRLEKREALLEARKQGAYVFWNHPGWKRPTEWFAEISPLYDEERLFQGVELVNGRTVYQEAFAWRDSKGLAMIGASDIHQAAAPEDEDGRPITLLFAKSRDAAGVREALDAGRSVVWMGGELWGTEELLTGLWKGAVEVVTPTGPFNPKKHRTASLRLANRSAIGFQLKPLNLPEWVRMRGGSVDPLRDATLTMYLDGNAPAGAHNIALELEITNLHAAPGKNVVVTVPLALAIEPAS